MKQVRKIVCAHQGYELYGSDRVFVEAVRVLRKVYPQARIVVCLPRLGPIVEKLSGIGCETRFDSLFVLRKKGFLKLLLTAPVIAPAKLLAARREIADADLVYVSTIVVLNFLIAIRWHRRAVVHIHEIPPPLSRAVFRLLLRFSRAFLIFNSGACARAYAGLRQPSSLIFNGHWASGPPVVSDYDGEKPLKVLVIGRISRAKGQDLLVDAVERLPPDLRGRLRVRIVGNAFEGDRFERDLRLRVSNSKLGDVIELDGFQSDPRPFYGWSDVVVVPSRVVESFGLVAIEAMASAKAVIAADQGGLRDTVVDGETGWRFAPDSAADLGACLERALRNPDQVRERGVKGYDRFQQLFSGDIAAAKLEALFRSLP